MNPRPARAMAQPSLAVATTPIAGNTNAESKRRLAITATLIIGLLMLASSSPATAANPPTWVGSGTPAEKPANTNSYVVTSDPLNLWDGATTYGGANYPATLNTFPGPPVDVLMQQCFGGGFAKGMQASITQYTFTAATNWNELAWNTADSPPNNFTRAWNDSYPRSEGLYQHYLDATAGAAAAPPNPAVVQDPYAPGGPRYKTVDNPKRFENPSYASPDALVGGNPNPAGANNSRDLPFDSNQWAILIATKPDAPRFGQNIDRIYNSLRTVGFGVPTNHIVVLFGSNAANTATAGGTPINGPISLANFQNASVGGNLFGNITGQTSPGNPDSLAHLFVYNTGHGNSWTKAGGTAIANPGKTAITVTKKPANGFTDADGSDSNTGNIDLEIAFSQHFDPTGVTISIDGLSLGSILDEGLTPLTDLNPMVGTSFYWNVQVPLSFLNLDPFAAGPSDDIVINGLSTDLVTGITYNAFGDAWSVGLDVIPEPTTCALLVTGLATAIVFRRRISSQLRDRGITI